MSTHPLEPLNAAEVEQALALLKTLPGFNATTRVISVMLREPVKDVVYAWPAVKSPSRAAEAVIFDNALNSGSHVLLDLTTNSVEAVKPMPVGAQPTLSVDEQAECEAAVIRSVLFREALERHYGISDTSLVMVDIWSAGNYGTEEDRANRLARPLCFLRSEPGENGYARPLEGLRPVVDLNKMEVIRIEEYGKWPLPPNPANYAASRVEKFRSDIKALLITQPDGPGFQIDGNRMSWQNWEFVIGFNAREGLTLHDVRYLDQGRLKPILYRASLTEMVVPYGDPGPTQARKNAFDVGEYGMGMCANSLRLGCDCVGHIEYLDAHLCDSRGRTVTIQNAICIHEEDFGILWKHTDRRLPDAPEVRRSRRLVVSSVSTVENYEYGFFWYFYQDGNIQFEIKLTGILSLGVTHEGEKPIYGAMVAPLLYAPNHQHFFNVRLDVGIDGKSNTIQQLDVVADLDDEKNPYHNAFHVEATSLQNENQARANLSLETGRTWRFINPAVRNVTGDPVGYKFLPGDNAFPFASKNAWWRKRAGFVDHHVWVTPFHPDERYAAGDYPNQSGGGDGLVKWTAANRPIENTDVVFWYTFGHTHIPRPEDCPVMPAAYIGFLLKPNGFFDQNPANDVPPSTPAKHGGTCSHC
jgi:primary-amine oxidase